MTKQLPKTPQTARRPAPFVRHGIEIADDYAWIKAPNWQEVLRDRARLPADIRALLDAENAYANTMLTPYRDLRKTFLKELRGRIQEDDSEVPAPDGSYEYYGRHREGGEHELVCRRAKGTDREEILLDGDAVAKGKKFFDLGDAEHSPDHRLLAWSADDKGSELYALRIRDLATGEDLDDRIDDTEGSVVWTSDATAFYYVRVDENHRPARVFRHRLGTPSADDELILDDPGAAFFVHIRRTQSRAYLVIAVRDHDSSECSLLDLDDIAAKPVRVAPREASVRYDVEHHEDRLIIRTNADDAVDFKIVTAPVATPGRAHWQDLVPHRPGRLIVTGLVFRTFMIRLERENSLPRIVITPFADGVDTAIAFDEEAYSLGLETMLEYDAGIIRFSYSSMTTPEEIWDYDVSTHARTLRKRDVIPSGHNPADYVTRRLHVTARDGALVPVSLLYRRNTKIDGSAPLLLYGYGAYGSSMPAAFNSNRFSLVDRGFIYAIAHVRGGTDKGWNWYLDGKMEHKANTFRDFIDVAGALAEQRFTARGRIIAHGGSAGGMLMGAIANMAPALFAGIVADVPFVDVLNTMLDDTLPLTPPEWLEWGNPIADKAAFERLKSYSPYDNVTAQVYPPILALAGLTDPRVTYWEPAKWVARLRATMTSGGPVLLQTNMDAGHAGASGRFKQLEEVALIYAFALACAQEAWDKER
ncbi:S9 family peptidase [Methylovirgula sp. 4M-Z18]|uniref:S9 family peptidase n=1 Tax=Methylovirgula sp. 4M-Z18 TaxID=2293567 RepID=UPI000E2F01D3|nr:S9 family peptidase [Methylovirgula sp. 4M-Z18]RFB79577.1 S9 family peptidase [Methylovirgula sp. 4M-Z18]